MIQASYSDKELIINILTKAFDANQSVNYIVQQDALRIKRIQDLMDYSFDMCYHFGEVFLSDNREGCALIIFPDRKKTSIRSVLLDINLIVNSIGIRNLTKAMAREKALKTLHPDNPAFYYLWYVAVDPNTQHRGTGTQLMQELMERATLLNRTIYLETSTVTNIPWYEKLGFSTYNTLYFGYDLFCMRK